MARAPIQVLVIPYRKSKAGPVEFAVFHRSDFDTWQFIAGGAEEDETPEQAAKRESLEEAGVPMSLPLLRLDSFATVPKTAFRNAKGWPKSLYVVPEYAFAVDVDEHPIKLSPEHDEVRWLGFLQANELLAWDSNRTALWELNERLRNAP